MHTTSWRKIGSEVYWLSISDLESKLFESIWPIPNGVNYNSYLVGRGDEYLLIDSSKNFIKARELINLIGEVVDPTKVRHIAVLHTEPDHSGLVAEASALLGGPAIYSTSRAAFFMKRLFGIETKVLKDGDSLVVGGRSLKVIELPWVHWPDTMFLYLQDEGILFSSDAFGAFGAFDRPSFDSEVDFDLYLKGAKEYFATVVSKYRRMVLQDLEKLRRLGLEAKTIAPAHGIVLRDRIGDFTRALTSWCELRRKKKITVIYGSMYGFTERLTRLVFDLLSDKMQNLVVHDVSKSNVNEILSDILDSAGVLLLTPTYEAEVFPPMSNVIELTRIKKLGDGKLAAVLLTKLWGGYGADQVTSKLEAAGFRMHAPVMELTNYPSGDELEDIRRLLESFCGKCSENVQDVT
jgi:flavorubredoxin